MSSSDPKRLTPAETEVMDKLWQLGSATVREVHRALEAERDVAYNTVLTMLRILRDKGFVTSRRKGRADVYRPVVSREKMGRRSLREVVDRFFSGSAAALVSHLLDDSSPDPEEIRVIRGEVEKRLRRCEEADHGSRD
jgi:predicted transcriptional regulator